MKSQIDPKIIEKAIHHWMDNRPLFSKSDLRNEFSWITEDLAKEEIAFWIKRGLVEPAGQLLRRTSKRSDEKLVFLDIDGVLNHSSGDGLIDKDCLLNLAHIVASTKATLILISSWKSGWYKEEKQKQDDSANYLDQRLVEAGLTVYDKTTIHTQSRVIGIIDYVMKFDTESWVILDDDAWLYQGTPLERHCVATDYLAGGLTKNLADKAIEILR